MGPALKGNKIDDFGLFRNNFADSRKGIEFAVDRIKDNRSMSRFMWSSNRIDSIEDVNYLVEAITGHPSLTTVRLDHSFGHGINGYDVLCTLFTCGKSFSMIQMSGNNVCTGGNTVFSDCLSNNLPLEELYLANNGLNDADALLIADALKHNNKLRSLHLDGNHFTETGRVALKKAVYDYESLNSASDCNHTCQISGVEKNRMWNWSDPISNREYKIFTLLRMRNEEGCNVHHLNLELL